MRVLGLCCLVCLLRASSIAEVPSANRTQPVTVLLTYEKPYSQASFEALQRQARELLIPAGINLEIRERKEAAPGEQFSEVLVFQMKGHCSMEALPVGALSDERGALAMAYSSDGNILPFGEVECDRVRTSLQKVLGRGAPESYQTAFGAALGMVIAHEVYHMLSRSPDHTRHGLTKESLSAHEMLEGKLSLADAARLAIDRRLIPSR